MQLKNKDEIPYYSLHIKLAVEATVEPPRLPTTQTKKFTLPYHECRKGKRGFMRPDHPRSWLAKFIEFLNIEWSLGLQEEATFEGLYSEKNNLLRIDFYQPILQCVYEVDGAQHVAENQQIKPKGEREAKFAAQQRRDEIVDHFFEVHKQINLVRLKAYKATQHDNMKALSMSQQFEVAFKTCKAIYQSLYRTPPPVIVRETLIHSTKQNSSTLAQTLARIDTRYEGEFTALQISAKNEITLRCLRVHYVQISNAKFYLDAQLENRTAVGIFWGCLRQHELDIAEQNLALIGFKISNEQQLRTQFKGSLEDPLRKRGAKSKIVLKVVSIHAPTKPNTITIISLARAQTNIPPKLLS
jgi:hypothetical protein